MVVEIRTCKKCGFILDTRPGLSEIDGICMPCINQEKKKEIDFTSRQKWLTEYIKQNKTNKVYDCVVAVSGGKDSNSIVRRLIENHGVRNPLLVNVADEFTKTEAGKYNINNLVNHYDLDLITFRFNPRTFIENTRSDFFGELNPLKWIENRIASTPVEIAQNYGIKLVFYGENSAFEYGNSDELEIFDSRSTQQCKIIYMGAIYPYSIMDAFECAKKIGFKTLDDFSDWNRQGNIENFTQIDSIGYIMHIWTKFVKFGFQRVSDIACRFVREGVLTKEQAARYIKDSDYVCDPQAKQDFCTTIGISIQEFDCAVDKFANTNLVVKDVNSIWRRKDLL